MAKPETSLPEDILDLTKNTCLESVLADAYKQAAPVTLQNGVPSSRHIVEFDDQLWTVSRHGGQTRHGSSLILGSGEDRVFFRTHTHGTDWDGRRYTQQVDSTFLFDEMVATQKNAGVVAIRSLVFSWLYQPKPEIITVESMEPVSFDESFELIRKSSRAILALAGKA